MNSLTIRLALAASTIFWAIMFSHAINGFLNTIAYRFAQVLH
jgi:hypothetical protein